MYIFYLILIQFPTAILSIDYQKEAERLARDYEETYGHKLISFEPDEVENKPLKTLAFGSCHSLKHAPPQEPTIWNKISSFKPDLFLWTGDSVYSSNRTLIPDETSCEDVKIEYEKMLKYKPYADFVKSVRVDGVYDDHDYGMNDGDRTFSCKHLTKGYFLDFLNKPKDNYRRSRDGVYFSVEYRDPDNPQNIVKLIALDIRFNKDPYKHNYYKGRFSFFITSFKRSLDANFGLNCSHVGDFLGETQWRWLEGQLYNSKASAHILVSSIQVFNKYSYQESWKLLPYSQRRLASLLFKTQPKGLVILSGDVHYANIEGDQNLFEITSSSLTHSVKVRFSMASKILSILINYGNNDVYSYNNFGLIEYRFNDHMESTYRLVNSEGRIVRTYFQAFNEKINPYKNLSSKNILCYFFHECFVSFKYVYFLAFLVLCLIIFSVCTVCIRIFERRSMVKELLKSKQAKI